MAPAGWEVKPDQALQGLRVLGDGEPTRAWRLQEAFQARTGTRKGQVRCPQHTAGVSGAKHGA